MMITKLEQEASATDENGLLTSHVLGGGGGVVDSFVHIYMILFILDKHLLNAFQLLLDKEARLKEVQIQSDIYKNREVVTILLDTVST